MIHGLPFFISVVFILVTFLTAWLFWLATRRSNLALFLISIWLLIQAILGLNGFYTISNTIPPRIVLMILPPLLAILLLFILPKGRYFIDELNPKLLTLLHIIRIPVETGLLLLYLHKQIPQLMTFEGRNFDILSGITAPFIWYFGYVKKTLTRQTLIAWNILCLGLVLNVVTHGILSAPTVFQKLAFDQPNVGIMYFPFNWLPSFIVPIVIFCHLACIRKLIKPANALAF